MALAIAIHLLRFQLRRVDAETVLGPLFEKYAMIETDRKMVLAYIHSRSFFEQWLEEFQVPKEQRDAVRDDLIRDAIVMLSQIQIHMRQVKNLTAQLFPPKAGPEEKT